MTDQQLPSVGRTVHYVSYGTPAGEYTSQCRAAIVTEVVGDPEDGIVSLCVLNPEGLFLNRAVHLHADADKRQGGSWHWPERVSP